MEMEEELRQYEEQLGDVLKILEGNPEDGDALALKAELEEMIQLTKDVIEEEKKEAAQAQAQVVAPIDRKESKGASNITLISQSLSVKQGPLEFSGWKVGDVCTTVWLGDGKMYDAVVSQLKPTTRSAVVTFVGYNNQQDTPLDFMTKKERVGGDVEEGAAAASEESAKKKKKTDDGERKMPVILATDSELVVKRKKLEMRKIKKEMRRVEKEKEQEKKVSSWKEFQKTSGIANKTSIFKSPDGVAGSVGISNSGKGITNNQSGARKKWTTTTSSSNAPDPK